MRMLITGADGQLGKALQDECQKQNLCFTAYNKANLDITNLNSIEAIVNKDKPTVIINCAAYNDVDGAEDNFDKALLVNRTGPKNLTHIAKDNGIVLMHFSTDYVFDGKNQIAYTEDVEPNPISKYGLSKLEGEQVVLEYDLAFIIRLSWVFGNGNNFITKVINWARNNKQLRIVDDQISSPTYTVDAAKTILKLVKTKEYGLYHLANSGFCSRYIWAKYIINTLSLPTEIIPVKSIEFNTKAERPECSVLCKSKIINMLHSDIPTWKSATTRFLLTE